MCKTWSAHRVGVGFVILLGTRAAGLQKGKSEGNAPLRLCLSLCPTHPPYRNSEHACSLDEKKMIEDYSTGFV